MCVFCHRLTSVENGDFSRRSTSEDDDDSDDDESEGDIDDDIFDMVDELEKTVE